MGRLFQPAQLTADAGVPNVVWQEHKASETFTIGAVLIEDGTTGDVKEAANGVKTGIWGVSLQPAYSSPGNQLAFSNLINATYGVTGLQRKVSMAVANSSTVFSGRMVNGGTDPVTPAQTDIGLSYALIITSVGGINEWTVNQADTATNPCVFIVGVNIDAQAPIVYFKFIATALAHP